MVPVDKIIITENLDGWELLTCQMQDRSTGMYTIAWYAGNGVSMSEIGDKIQIINIRLYIG